MNNYFVIDKIDQQRWINAQQWEKKVWENFSQDGDDWNSWWRTNFDSYLFLAGKKFKNVMEVGCGPWAKNMNFILDIIGHDNKSLYLEDPLLDDYILQGKSIKNINAIKISKPLEELNVEEKMDLIICINVLDHVYSVPKCFENIINSLNKGGTLIFANDLTNEDDYKNMPIADVGHPIRIDLDICDSYLSKLTQIYKKVLPREAGRNPPCHYATLLYAGCLE